MRKAILAKEAKVSEIREKVNACQAIILTEYRGLKVKEMEQLRNDCRKQGIEYVVFKNSLAKRAIQGSSYESLSDYFVGPTGVAFGMENPVALTKILTKFSKEHKDLKVKIGSIEGELLKQDDLVQVSNLPPKEVLLAQLLGGLSSPMVSLVNVLTGPLRGLVCALKAISEQKGEVESRE